MNSNCEIQVNDWSNLLATAAQLSYLEWMQTPVNEKLKKSEVYWKVLSAVLKLEMEKGHLQWKMTEVARISGVQRTLIYYYFGTSKESLIDCALQMISEDFFGLPNGRIQRDLSTTIAEARKLVEEAPHILLFYLHWRTTPSPIGEKLRFIEDSYKKRLEITFPHLLPDERDSLFALFFGLVSFPNISGQAIKVATRSLGKILPSSTKLTENC